MSKETVKIEAPNLIEFVYDIEKKVKEGYSVDDTNEGIPQSWGPGLYTCTLSKEVSASKQETVETTEEKTESVTEEKSEEAPKKTTRRTRKKSN